MLSQLVLFCLIVLYFALFHLILPHFTSLPLSLYRRAPPAKTPHRTAQVSPAAIGQPRRQPRLPSPRRLAVLQPTVSFSITHWLIRRSIFHHLARRLAAGGSAGGGGPRRLVAAGGCRQRVPELSAAHPCPAARRDGAAMRGAASRPPGEGGGEGRRPVGTRASVAMGTGGAVLRMRGGRCAQVPGGVGEGPQPSWRPEGSLWGRGEA